MQVTKGALNAQAIAAQSLEMSAPGHEGHILASSSQPAAQIPTDPAGAHYRDPHGRSPL
jgi:hypothetical protein